MIYPLLQEICIYLRPEESSRDIQPFMSIKFFDDILRELVGVEMERFLCCSTCLGTRNKERYFSKIGAGFVPRDSSERCKSFYSGNQDRLRPCNLDEQQESLMAHQKATQVQPPSQAGTANQPPSNPATQPGTARGDGWNYGMIIGNSEYTCPGLSDLPSIKTDRELIYHRLGTHGSFNIDFSNSEHLTQIKNYTNVEDITGRVEAFLNQVEEKVTKGRGRGGGADTLLMFFLGHGGNVQGVDCMLGVKGKPYPVNSIIHKILDKSNAKKIIMILDFCRNKLNEQTFILSNEEVENAKECTDFTKIIRIWSAEETHKATDRSGATFSEALCEVLERNPNGVEMRNLEQILNEQWGEKQKQHHKMKGRVLYSCKVDLTRDYNLKFPFC